VVAVSTVGYGDILPVTDTEMLYNGMVLLLGTAVFAYATGTVTSVMFSQSSSESKVKQRLSQMEEMMR
jgi:hypothetical protein